MQKEKNKQTNQKLVNASYLTYAAFKVTILHITGSENRSWTTAVRYPSKAAQLNATADTSAKTRPGNHQLYRSTNPQSVNSAVSAHCSIPTLSRDLYLIQLLLVIWLNEY